MLTSPKPAVFGALAVALAATACAGHAPFSPKAEVEMTAAMLARAPTPKQALDVVSFWRDAGPSKWFAKDGEFDASFYDLFLDLHEAAARGELGSLEDSSDGVLALMLLLDQFPRNAFRGTPRMYETDAMARDIADRAIRSGMDKQVPADLRVFVYIAFGHSESLADQERSVALCRTLRPIDLEHAKRHHDIVARFGRFPHRNLILGREMRPEEQKYLDEGGYAG
jgi:uncharacterized protein (DUF924 family)